MGSSIQKGTELGRGWEGLGQDELDALIKFFLLLDSWDKKGKFA